MTRPLPITAAEVLAVQAALATGGPLWLVRDGVPPTLLSTCPMPPVEFVQASAPCETCSDSRVEPYPGGKRNPCPDCRIELVMPCPTCDGDPYPCWTCKGTYTVTLGHAYAVGSPLPIICGVGDQPGDLECIDVDCGFAYHWPAGKPPHYEVDDCEAMDVLEYLSHAGPPETLVGKWALQLAVVGS